MLELTRGSITKPEDLSLEVLDSANTPTDPFTITYALYDVTTGSEVLIGPLVRRPVRVGVGQYHAHFQIPENVAFGLYRLRWSIVEFTGDPVSTILQEFQVVEPLRLLQTRHTVAEIDMIRRLRIRLRDNSPDRNYHFRPPTSSGTVNQFNRVFAYIWEDEELLEYIDQTVKLINSYPPGTGYRNVSQMVAAQPNWITWIITGAMAQAAMALTFNWVADEFSVVAETLVTVLLPNGTPLELTIEDLYLCRLGLEDDPQPCAHIQTLQQSLKDGTLRVRSVDVESGDVRWSLLADVVKHHTPHKRIVQLADAEGRSVMCTEDHSVFLYNAKEGSIAEVEASCLDVGDLLAVAITEGFQASGCVLESVRDVPSRDFTYDLCVPGDENFVLSNGIIAHNTYSIGGISLDIERSSKYESLKQNAEQQFEKMMTDGKARTVKYMRGLKQSRYGVGVRSAFGPSTGKGTLTPRKFLGL